MSGSVTRLLTIGLLTVWLFAAPGAAAASWLDEIRSRIGFTGQGAETDQLTAAARVIAKLKVKPPALVLAASVTAEGHWTFVSQSGQRYTTASDEELARVYQNLAPDITGRPGPVVIYLTAASVFTHGEHLGGLPGDARLRLVTGGGSYPLRGFGRGAKRMWFAEVRANVLVRTTDAAVFREVVWQLTRPLKARAMRVLALDPAARDTFPPGPARDAGGQRIDAINPAKLISAMPTLRQQTAVITGRLEDGDKLTFRTPSGSERRLDLPSLRKVAATVDANLVLVNASAPRQPGARNWLWLKIEVDGLIEALQRETLGDFLNALAGGTGQLFVETRQKGADRVALNVIPMREGELEKQPSLVSSVLAEFVSEVVGSVVPHAVDADLVSMDRQRELDRRFVTGVPSVVQYGFGLALLIGLVGLPTALGWWRQIWGPEVRSEYANRVGFEMARGVRLIVFLLLFLPVVGVPAILWGIARGIGWLIGGGRQSGADAGAANS